MRVFCTSHNLKLKECISMTTYSNKVGINFEHKWSLCISRILIPSKEGRGDQEKIWEEAGGGMNDQ